MRDSVIRLGLLAVLLVASMAACQLGDAMVPTSSPTPTKTPTPTVTPTTTATIVPTPTATINPRGIVPLPHLEFVLLTLLEIYGENFTIVTGWGVLPDTIVIVGFESPVDSGKLHIAIFAWADGRWTLVEVVDVANPSQAESEEG